MSTVLTGCGGSKPENDKEFLGDVRGSNACCRTNQTPLGVCQVSTDDRFICLSEKLDMNDVLEFLYTGKLSNNALEVAESCDISKEEIESLDLSEILQNN